jgi:hypothetical protein
MDLIAYFQSQERSNPIATPTNNKFKFPFGRLFFASLFALAFSTTRSL